MINVMVGGVRSNKEVNETRSTVEQFYCNTFTARGTVSSCAPYHFCISQINFPICEYGSDPGQTSIYTSSICSIIDGKLDMLWRWMPFIASLLLPISFLLQCFASSPISWYSIVCWKRKTTSLLSVYSFNQQKGALWKCKNNLPV